MSGRNCRAGFHPAVLPCGCRSRHSNVTAKATRPDGASSEISTKLVGPMPPQELRTFVTDPN
ncbi:hypothetical protein AQI88_04110 [Streptomyces cellostaticus]|uniref:Uncharacterized protein n=1 Tax=Streptomyces cellostaticus TaxID=67285 RepID=A0A101NRY8_9ACTN|nr:hypothetical protein [Streptomyces cellostaticus]KUM98174.1 hypothetical protein AQI88_04110 [Streptomyces cellostaticus]GHI08656.1 hypothetical protein Scel_69770 [Streptomyces cellostaticus]